MKQVRFEFEELPYDTLSQFGLTQEMIEDLPMHILEELSHGRHSPVLPIKVTDENGNTVMKAGDIMLPPDKIPFVMSLLSAKRTEKPMLSSSRF